MFKNSVYCLLHNQHLLSLTQREVDNIFECVCVFFLKKYRYYNYIICKLHELKEITKIWMSMVEKENFLKYY